MYPSPVVVTTAARAAAKMGVVTERAVTAIRWRMIDQYGGRKEKRVSGLAKLALIATTTFLAIALQTQSAVSLSAVAWQMTKDRLAISRKGTPLQT